MSKSAAAPKNDHSAQRYAKSNEMLARAERVIPLGSQTFSKSRIQFPVPYSPLYLTHGKGGRVWDVDGNEYVDLVSALMPVTLGYCDPDVNAAIAAQLEKGISFSLPTELEIEVAERLQKLIPSAEMVRFGKNGTDATSAAVRLARAFTGRDHILALGYHGWQDWYIGATARNLGVPKAVSELTHKVPFNDLPALSKALESFSGQVAAIILEPVNIEPAPGYLQEAIEAAHRHGALVIFDEVITGFRVHTGGAQAHYGVKPDLSAFGKAMGNGMPVSAVVGRADIMAYMEKIFYSGTFGGEALSLAASKAVIDKMAREPVIKTIWDTGRKLSDGADRIIAAHGLQDTITFTGLPHWRILNFHDRPGARKEAIKTRYLIEMLRSGVLVGSSHNVSYAHTESDVAHVLSGYEIACARIAEDLRDGKLEDRLEVDPIFPVFTVRG